MEYQPGKDYCTVVPDMYKSYDMSGCCYLHDLDWMERKKSKFKSDWDFYQ